MEVLYQLIATNASFLLKTTLEYARLHGYTKYTSTLQEAWVGSIKGLSGALLNILQQTNCIPELDVDIDFEKNEMSAFGILEAKKHRERGITLEMFMGLMKYYRQSYLDLISLTGFDKETETKYKLFINRFFDHTEIGFCSEWNRQARNKIVGELQTKNRGLTNEKNKYLTIFESIPTPVILLDSNDNCINLNFAAVQFLDATTAVPGLIYYGQPGKLPIFDQIMPWLFEEFQMFRQGKEREATYEKEITVSNQGPRNFVIKFHRMLDISGKFEGTVIILTDLTEQKQIEEELRFISFHDKLTGLYNRAYFEQELNRIEAGRLAQVGVVTCDIDGLKTVNDTLGHEAGDVLLQTTGEILRKCFRLSDMVARIGGDEFAVLMPASPPDTVEAACQRIRDEIDQHNRDYPHMPISVSVGWAIGSKNNNIHELLKLADDQMYAEKMGNRSQYARLFRDRQERYGGEMFKLS